MWEPISTAPHDRDVELAIIDRNGERALVIPCRRVPDGWVNAVTKRPLEVQPTHWRECKR